MAPAGKLSASLDANNCSLADGTWFADYRIVFPVRGIWTADTSSFTLILRDQSGSKLESGSSIRHNVERGTYHLIVNGTSPNEGGAFDLTSAFTPAAGVLCYDFPLLATSVPTSGTLGPQNCMLPDGSAFGGYQATLFGAGTLDVAVTASGFLPLVIVRGSDGAALGSATTTDESGVVHLILPEIGNDTYTVVIAVSSPDQQGGAYSVQATFSPDDGETCLSQAQLTPGQFTGTISLSSCAFNLPGRGDNAPFNFYTIHLDTPGLVQASVNATDFSSLLLLVDAAGNSIGEDLQSSTTGTPLIRQQLPAGDYRVLVFNEESAAGQYTLDYQYTAATALVCQVVLLDPASAASGMLAGASSCLTDGLLSDAYTFTLDADATVELAITSPDFTPLIELRDVKDNTMTWGSDRLSLDLRAGTYFVRAASTDRPGDYSLAYSITPKALAPCDAPRQMPPNGFIHNTQLGTSSCVDADGRRADYYQFTLSAPATEGIFMTSDSVTPEITLYQADGTVLRMNQNGYVDNNAAILQYLPAGAYQIRLRSADPTQEGPYNLDLLSVPGPAPQLCSPKSLAPGGTVNGSTSITSCALPDKTLANVYRMDSLDVAQVITLDAQSDSFDPFLVLLDAKGNVLVSDDNGGGGSSASIEQVIAPGTYYVIVKPASDATTAGAYFLQSGLAPVPPAPQ